MMPRTVIRHQLPRSRGSSAVVITIALLGLTHLSWSEFPTLEDVAATTPNQDVVIQVSFHRIQRTPAIVDILADSGLALEHVRFKNVGSGGGESGVGDPYARTQPVVDTPKEVEAALARIEEFHADHYESLARAFGTYKNIDCPYDDFTSPVKDTHGIPGDYSEELSCGLRIVGIRLRGTAEKAQALANAHKGIAEFVRMPTNDEILRWRQEMIDSQDEHHKLKSSQTKVGPR